MKRLKSPLQTPILKHPDETFDARDLTDEERFRLISNISIQAWKLRELPIPEGSTRHIVEVGRMKDLKS